MSKESGEHLGHEVSYKTYVAVALALVCLTAITVWASRQNFGAPAINIVIAMAIASLKASLVALWFMHLKYENTLTWIFVIFPIALLALLIGFSLSDELLRAVQSMRL
jgi:cytochrome c oxidase subunit 4